MANDGRTIVSASRLFLAASAMCLLTASTSAESGRVEVAADAEGLLASENGMPVLYYQRATKSWDGKFARANYVHPLYDLDGREISEDFPADHRHHRGVFWAWHQLWVGDEQIGDAWTTQDFLWEVQRAEVESADDGSAAIKTLVHWKSPKWADGKPVVAERAVIRIHPRIGAARSIDFEIRLLALQANTRLGGSDDAKGYGGFSPRIRLPDDARFQGEHGDVEPQRTSVAAGRWVNLTGTLNGKTLGGIAMLTHPTLPVFPPEWILRRKNSMQNPVFPGRKPVPLSETEPLVLRYRLVIHRGNTDREEISQWQRSYAKTAVAAE